MNLIDEIFKQLNAGKAKDSPEILALLATVKDADPGSHEIATKIVNNWPEPSKQPRPWSDLIPGRNALMGGGLGVAGLASVPWIQPFMAWLQQNVALPAIYSPTALFFIVAGLGAITGAAYSICVHGGVVLPSLGQQKGVLTLTRFGIVNEVGFGALAAVTTIWIAAVGLAPAIAGPVLPAVANAPENPPVPQSLLTYSVVLGSLVSGWFGARMRSSRLDQALLTDALSKTAVRDKQGPGMEERILKAPSAAAAASLATGMEVVGTKRPSPSATIPPTTP